MDPIVNIEPAQQIIWQKIKLMSNVYTFDVEATAVLVPTFESDLVAQDGKESFKFFATAFLFFQKGKSVIKCSIIK